MTAAASAPAPLAAPATRFVLPPELHAESPPEARGLTRDGVRLLVAEDDRPVRHTTFRHLDRHLRAGDLLVVNTSGTLPAALDGTRLGPPLARVVLHVASADDGGPWVVELRTAPHGADPVRDARPGERLRLPDGRVLTLLGPHVDGGAEGTRLWRAAVPAGMAAAALLARHGRPIRYSYVPREWPIEAYQTVFAEEAGSAEMPSAGRPFSTDLVTRLVGAGVLVAPVLLHTGVSSQESHEPPPAERFRVPAGTAALTNWVRSRGGRVVAVGTTATRALESAARPDGTVTAAHGWTDLVLGPDRPARTVDGLVTGWHAPEASHLLLLEAVAGPPLVRRAYDAALTHHYLWHEFGDSALLLHP